MKRWFVIPVLLLAAHCAAQVGESTQSVVEAARASRNQALKAKKVLDDDSVRTNRSGFPDISLTTDNSAQIVAAIRDYDAAHSPTETEAKTREWYDIQDAEMSRIADQVEGTSYNPVDQCSNRDERDYMACEREQQRRMMLARAKYNEAQRSMARMNAILRNVRSQLSYYRMNYRWMVEHQFPYGY
jgi:hypothetical protein